MNTKKKYALHITGVNEHGEYTIPTNELAKLWNVEVSECEVWGVTIPESPENFEHYVHLSKMAYAKDYFKVN